MITTIEWNGLVLRVLAIEGVGFALRPVSPPSDRLALPLLGRRLWELCCRSPVRIEGVREVVASEVELLLQTHRVDAAALLRGIGDHLGTVDAPRPRRFRLPVCFEFAEDWDFVTAHTGLARETVIERLLLGEFVLGMYGFLPGFAYLRVLDPALRCPRRSSPRARVEAGTVALGGEYLGVYGLPSPGGWHSIGRTPSTVFSLRDLPPLDLEVGDVVVLERIDARDFDTRRGVRLRDLAQQEDV